MANKTCRFISNRGMNDSPSASEAEVLYETLILPVMNKHFPEFVTYLFQFEADHSALDDDFIDKLIDVDLVIADLSHLPASGYFQLGMRQQSGRPLVLIADADQTMALHPTELSFVTYTFESHIGEDEVAAANLANAIRAALDEETPLPHPSLRDLTVKQNKTQLITRIFEAAESIRLLRVNSAAETAEELERIATELETVQEDRASHELKEVGIKVLKILSRIADQLRSVKGSRIIAAGIISVVVGGSGVSAMGVYALTLAYWQGEEAFTKAIQAMAKRKR